MSSFVKYSNLPERAEKVLIGEEYYNILSKFLINADIQPIKVPKNPFVDSRVASHADLSVFHPGGEGIYLAPYLKNTALSNELINAGFKIRFPKLSQGSTYPEDCQFNLCSFGNYLIYSKDTACQEIIESIKNESRINLVVRQGYTKCSVCVVDENSIITADKGIAASAVSAGIDVLEISPGHIHLEGFDYGFIGGAAFKSDRNTLAFTGTLDNHPDCNKILSFLKSKDIKAVFLSDLEIFDAGSIIPITEK